MIQRCLVYDTVMFGVWYSDVCCMIQRCLVYDTVMFGVWYGDVWCMYWSVMVGVRIHVSYSKSRGIIHQTSRYHTPNIAVSYTKHRGVIHQTSLDCPYHTTNNAVSCVTPHCTVHQTSLHHAPPLYRTHHHSAAANARLAVSCTRQLYHTTLSFHAIILHTAVFYTVPAVSYTRHRWIIH